MAQLKTGKGEVVGHRRMLNGEIKKLLYGNGCPKWHDCFTCPFPDCTWNNGTYYSNENPMKEKAGARHPG